MSTASTAATTPVAVRPSPSLGAAFFHEVVSSMLVGLGLLAIFSAAGGDQTLQQAAAMFTIGLLLVAVGLSKWGAHANPDVTVGKWLAKMGIRGPEVGVRIAGQCVGWSLIYWIGVLFVYHEKAALAGFGVPHAVPGTPTPWRFLVPMIGLFLFVSTAIVTTDLLPPKFATLGGIGLAFSLGLLVYYTAGKGGGGINAMRELVPMVYAGDFPWVQFIGGRIGTVLAGLAFRSLGKKRYATA